MGSGLLLSCWREVRERKKKGNIGCLQHCATSLILVERWGSCSGTPQLPACPVAANVLLSNVFVRHRNSACGSRWHRCAVAAADCDVLGYATPYPQQTRRLTACFAFWQREAASLCTWCVPPLSQYITNVHIYGARKLMQTLAWLACSGTSSGRVRKAPLPTVHVVYKKQPHVLKQQ